MCRVFCFIISLILQTIKIAALILFWHTLAKEADYSIENNNTSFILDFRLIISDSYMKKLYIVCYHSPPVSNFFYSSIKLYL